MTVQPLPNAVADLQEMAAAGRLPDAFGLPDAPLAMPHQILESRERLLSRLLSGLHLRSAHSGTGH